MDKTGARHDSDINFLFVSTANYETHINPVFLLQKRAVRAISFEHYTGPSTSIFSDLKILKLQDLTGADPDVRTVLL